MYDNIKAWPMVEALAILNKINNQIPSKGYVLFETGYGPSGLPHIGTFGEVAKNVMVERAFKHIAPEIPTKILCVSDDMDGLRKVPENIPNKEHYKQYLNMPLTAIPDPFGTHESYGHHMNARLRDFLDRFEFQYEFKSSTECYKTGIFNKMLLRVLKHYDEIMNLMLPTLGDERQKTYSPFLPICPRTGRVLQVPIIARGIDNITYVDPETNENITVKVTDGCCKLQWKPDFAMRWAAFEVDFEAFGKDVGANAELYTKICEIIGGIAPKQMTYELYLDEEGKKISKSKGTGLTIDDWLRYAPQETLRYFMYCAPFKAKKLSFSIIPRYVDEYINYLDKDHDLENPMFYINQTKMNIPVSYSLLLNLVSACNTDSADVIWGYLIKMTNAQIRENAFVTSMVKGTLNYYHDFIKPYKQYRIPNEIETNALSELKNILTTSQNLEDIQNQLYQIAKNHNIDIKNWFISLYEILLGASSGPRFGSFITLYGAENTIKLIDVALTR
jgi:lysyl-tRNA synthetase class 1